MQRSLTSRRLGALLGLILFVALLLGQAQVLAGHDTSNEHTNNGIYHGWVRRYHAFDSGYHYHAWTEHGHGYKYVSGTHAGITHSHCDRLNNTDHVHCDYHVGGVKHSSFHDAPGGGTACDKFNDGHGICAHEMEAILS
ncbi:MAG: hypothetical protein ACREA0_11310 [bacterium]